MVKILVGSPIRQNPEILKQFLIGLSETENEGIDFSYFFVDDNTEEESSRILSEFAESNNAIIKKGSELISSIIDNEYKKDDKGHHWKPENIDRITCFKDIIIEYCVRNGFDYLFLVDSDIVLFKKTVSQLLSDNVDIVSEVFWTQWQVNKGLSPQCFWIPDLYKQDCGFNKALPVEEANRIRREMVEQLKEPGMYPVDGLGACTLISKKALENGVRFKRIPNLSVQGEDRHFCIRAGALGFELYMDSRYPVYHIYRSEYLSRVDEFKCDGFKFDMCQTYTQEYEMKKEKSSFFAKAKRKFERLLKKTR